MIVLAPQTYAATIFTKDLRLGVTHSQVKELQKVLNSDQRTTVASFGPGSLGNETDYFGSKTRTAVVKFQELYKKEILYPVALVKGTGLVGTKTREKLNKIYTAFLEKDLRAGATATPTDQTNIPDIFSSVIPPYQNHTNPNEVNLDLFINQVLEVNKDRGLSEEKLAKIESRIRKDAATTTDFRVLMAKQMQERSGEQIKTSRIPKTLSRLFGTAITERLTYLNVFKPKTVFADPGLAFNGLITYRYPCSCSETWLVGVYGPSGGLFDYEIGTQEYQYFNLPNAEFAVGDYTPATVPVCYSEPESDCTVVIETRGVITGQTGTSSQ